MIADPKVSVAARSDPPREAWTGRERRCAGLAGQRSGAEELRNRFLLFLLLCHVVQGFTGWYEPSTVTHEAPAQGHNLLRIGTGWD